VFERRDCLEAHPLSPVRILFYNIAVLVPVLSRVARSASRKKVKLLYGFLAYRQQFPFLMDEAQGFPVAPDFFFIPVPQHRLSKNDCGDPGAVNGNSFNAV
jgi:hypothetical protein